MKLGEATDKVIFETEAVGAKTNGSRNILEISEDQVKNKEKKKFEKTREDVIQLPRGWRTRNTLGSKGFRIYSPPGFGVAKAKKLTFF